MALQLLKNLLKKEKTPIINILTRTSGRPNGFKKCNDSIENQTYNNFHHIVSYESLSDLDYLNNYTLKAVSVAKKSHNAFSNSEKKYEPYNLYCNELIDNVKDGWIMFLDDDDMLAHKRVLKILQKGIMKNDEDTLFIWQTKFPDGSMLPSTRTFQNREIRIQEIDTACFMFHSKYKDAARWDSFWAADFRFIRDLAEVIPKQIWIDNVLTLKNNFGDGGNRNDINI